MSSGAGDLIRLIGTTDWLSSSIQLIGQWRALCKQVVCVGIEIGYVSNRVADIHIYMYMYTCRLYVRVCAHITCMHTYMCTHLQFLFLLTTPRMVLRVMISYSL